MTPKSLEEDNAFSGLPPYRGYEYQILATVWIALDLLTKGRSDAVIVEPPSEEDVAADVAADSNDADWGVKVAQVQVQIKLRNHALWKPQTFNALLRFRTKAGQSGPAPRIRPLEYLNQHPLARYLLLTNADVDVALRAFQVKRVGDSSSATRLPCTKSDNPDLASRIGILPPLTSDHLDLDVKQILQRKYHVPGERLDDCLEALLKAVRQRLLGERQNRLAKDELLLIVRQHGGSYKDPHEPIHSTKHGLITEKLRKRNSLIIVGPPGTGKTTLATHFVAQLETNDPPYRRVLGNAQNIAEIRKMIDNGDNHVFYFEDPWGQEPPVSAETEVITSELPKLMKLARAGKVFVVTSRLSVFRAAVQSQEKLFDPFTEQLLAEDYDRQAYRRLFDHEIEDWTLKERTLARQHRKSALENLQTPYSVVIFCQAFRQSLEDGEHIYSSMVEKMSKESNVGAFGAVLKQSLIRQGHGTVAASVALWAMLIVHHRKLAFTDAQEARRLLQRGGMPSPPDVQKLFNALVEAQWLQSRADGYVATPSVLESLASLEQSEPACFSDTAVTLFRGWTNDEAFVNILACVKESKDLNSSLPEDLAAAFDTYLVEQALNAEDHKFAHAYFNLAECARTGNPVVLLAKAFNRREALERRNRYVGYAKWQPPALESAARDSLSASPEAQRFIKRFIEVYLPYIDHHTLFARGYVADEFVTFVNQFGWDLTDSFKSAFLRSVTSSESGTSFLAECSCKLDVEFVDTAFEKSLTAYLDVWHHEDPSDGDLYRQATQGEMDAAEAEWRFGEPPDYYFHAEDALEKAVELKWAKDGYDWIPLHEHAVELLTIWAKLIKRDSSLDELATLVKSCSTQGELAPAFRAIECKPSSEMLPWIAQQLCAESTQLPYNWAGVIEKFIDVQQLLIDALEIELAKNDEWKCALLAFVILQMRVPAEHSENTDSVDADESRYAFWEDVLGCIVDQDVRELLTKCRLCSLSGQAVSLTDKEVERTTNWVESWPDLPGVHVLGTVASTGRDVSAQLPRFLKSEDAEVRKHALALCQDRAHLLTLGLSDDEYSCRVAAIQTTAAYTSDDDVSQILKLSSDRSCFVREVIAAEIGRRMWSEGIPTLVGMLTDNRDYSERMEGERHDFHVARTACSALRKFDAIPEDVQAQLISFLNKCVESTRDTTVHGLLFRLLAEHPTEEFVSFCSRYIATAWFESAWRDNQGHALLSAALRAIIASVELIPDLAKQVDTPVICDLAMLDDDAAWLTAPAITALCLCSGDALDELSEISAADSFNMHRAVLMLALLSSTERTPADMLQEWISKNHPLNAILSWVSDGPTGASWGAFLQANSTVDEWLRSLMDGDEIYLYTRWAIGRLLGDVEHEGTLGELPQKFRFPRIDGAKK